MEVTFNIPGRVRGQGRPRSLRNGRTYKAREDRAWEKHVADCYRTACPVRPGTTTFGSAPVEVSLHIFPALPKSTPKRVEEDDKPVKPDIDNVIKGILDALNGVAWEDDCQVRGVMAFRHPRRRRDPYTMVTVCGGFDEEKGES